MRPSPRRQIWTTPATARIQPVARRAIRPKHRSPFLRGRHIPGQRIRGRLLLRHVDLHQEQQPTNDARHPPAQVFPNSSFHDSSPAADPSSKRCFFETDRHPDHKQLQPHLFVRSRKPLVISEIIGNASAQNRNPAQMTRCLDEQITRSPDHPIAR